MRHRMLFAIIKMMKYQFQMKSNEYKLWFPKLQNDNHLEVAGSIQTAGE